MRGELSTWSGGQAVYPMVARMGKMGLLYKLDFSSGKSYIGITTSTSIGGRLRHHRHHSKTGKLAVNHAWRKHGEPKVTILAIAILPFLLELERRAIAVYKTHGLGGYNLTPGGDIVMSPTPESRAKLSAIAKNRRFSAETRARMSAASKGRPKSLEARQKMSVFAKRRTYSAETRAKLSASAKLRKITPETRAKMSEIGKVRVFTAQHRANIASAKTGSKHSPETIAKLTGRVFSSAHRRNISKARRAAFALRAAGDPRLLLDLSGSLIQTNTV